MQQQPGPRTLIRTNWISNLTVALGDAERLLATLEADGEYPAETLRLRHRVETVRSEVELLNRMMGCGDRVMRTPWPDPTSVHAGER